MWQKISVIIPVLNEAKSIADFLQPLQYLRSKGHELIVVDGHSDDNTVELANSLVDQLVVSERGRARQQAAGVAACSGQIYLFLHADTQLPEQADEIILRAFSNGSGWGRFNVHLSGRQWLFRIIEWFMNWRSCLTGIATGDQSIFVSQAFYRKAGGMPLIELMEDIEFSKQLKKLSRPVCLRQRVITSSRRWEKNGILKTILLMWSLRLQYFLGVSPSVLLKKYYR